MSRRNPRAAPCAFVLVVAALGLLARAAWTHRRERRAVAPDAGSDPVPGAGAHPCDEGGRHEPLAARLRALERRVATLEAAPTRGRPVVCIPSAPQELLRLGILVAVVLPQLNGAAEEARAANLVTNLQTLRSQLALYKTQHLEQYPGGLAGPGRFVAQMTQYTDAAGDVSPTPGPDFAYGPYLAEIPENPISGLSAVRVVDGPAAAFTAPEADGGWWFNRATGEFRADLTDAHVGPDGTPMNAL
jgi:general secretion pathway protein G